MIWAYCYAVLWSVLVVVINSGKESHKRRCTASTSDFGREYVDVIVSFPPIQVQIQISSALLCHHLDTKIVVGRQAGRQR